MAENDNEEYQFTEIDPLNPSFEEGTEVVDTDIPASTSTSISTESPNNIKRNAIIAVGVFVLLMILYKIVGSFFSEKKAPTKALPSLEISTSAPAMSAQPSVVEAPPVTSVTTTQPDVGVKLSALESGQENLDAQVSSLNSQLEMVNSSLQSLTDKLNEMNTTITQLSAKLEDQAHKVEVMAHKPDPVVKVVHVKKVYRRLLIYRIQAVIPGRAWLIASNGTTVTVRAGSRLPGYGVVRGIDVSLGRVLTSSGKVIRFGQNDS